MSTTAALSASVIGSIRELDTAGLGTTCGAFHAPGRLAQFERDSRWTIRYVVIDREGEPVIVVPCWTARVAAWGDPVYEQAVNELAGGPVQMNRCLFVGGYGEIPAGVLRHPRRDPAIDERAAALAAEQLAILARSEDLRVVAPLVTERERPLIRLLMGPEATERTIFSEARLPAVGSSEADFLASLGKDQRKKVRREWRRRQQSLVAVRETAWEATLDYAPAMICDVTQRHGLPEHPSLVRARLEEWLEVPGLDCVAFEARCGDDVLAVSFGLRRAEILSMYVVGMAGPDVEQRLQAYVETTIYMPLAYAYQAGCTDVSLGFKAVTPKHQRGALITKVTSLLAISQDTV